MTEGFVVAIDGPSGVGKSTVSRRVAAELGLQYLDTGATYRLAALWALREGVALDDGSAIAAGAETMNASVTTSPDDPRFFLEGEDVSAVIRGEAVTMAVSHVATNLQARAALGRWQRELIAAARPGIVVEGRDITDVIAPEAPVRVLMVADPEVRVSRRAAESRQGDDAAVREAVLGRDARDAAAVNVVTAEDGVVTLDTTDMDIEQAVDAVLALAREAGYGTA